MPIYILMMFAGISVNYLSIAIQDTERKKSVFTVGMVLFSAGAVNCLVTLIGFSGHEIVASVTGLSVIALVSYYQIRDSILAKKSVADKGSSHKCRVS